MACEIGLGEQAKGAEARVVDQVVDADAGGHHPPGQRRGGAGLAQVGGQDRDGDVVTRLPIGGDLMQRRLAAGGEHEIGAGAGELLGDGTADTSGGAGDEGGVGGRADRHGAALREDVHEVA